jgi:hypothetical protein
LDSFDTVECVMAIEDEFCSQLPPPLSFSGVEFPDEVAEVLSTPREAVKAIMNVQAGPSPQKRVEAGHDHDHGHDDHGHH